MSQNKKIVKNSLLLYIRLIVTTIIGLFTSRIVFRNLGFSDYGLYSVVASIIIMMNFFNTVMISTTYRFIAYEMGRNEKQKINNVFNISLSIHLMLTLLVIILAETIGIWYIHNKLNVEIGKLGDAIFVFRLSIIATVFSIIGIPFMGFITALEKFSVRVSIEILRSFVRLIFVILLVYLIGNKLRIYAIMMAIIAFVPTFLYIVYCRKYYTNYVRWKFPKNKKKFKEMFAFSSWIMIGAAASVGKSNVSQIIINAFFGTILNAAYGIANRLNSFVIMFSRNLSQAAIPQITKSFSSGNDKRTLGLVAYIGKYSFLLMLIPSLPILLETKYLLTLWLGEVPEYTIAFTRLMIIHGLIESLSAGIPAAIQATGKIKWFVIISSTIMLLSLPLSYFLFKIGYPPFYLLIVYISTAVLNFVVTLFLLKKIINFDVIYLLKTAYLKISFVVASILPLFWIVNIFESSLQRMIYFSIVSLLCLFTMIYLIGFDVEEKMMIKKQSIKLFQKFAK